MTICILPAELVSYILCYTNPRDIIRWRSVSLYYVESRVSDTECTPFLQVSKWFGAITHDPAIWKALYANAPFICPPGPFPSQLERTLVRSARLAQSWTTQPVQAVSRVEIPFDGEPNDTSLIGGRWLIVCQSKRRIVLYDTDADVETHVPQILWEQEEHCQWQIRSWDSYSLVSEEGQWVVYVILQEVLGLGHRTPARPW